MVFASTMKFFRFVTPHRAGKWYPSLETARQQAAAIGAGFLDRRTGVFVAYCGTRLESRERAKAS